MRDCKKVLVSPSTPIIEVMQFIEESSIQIALVVDEQARLKGTATDGDIRRGLLKGIALASPISEVMFRSPTVARLNDSSQSILSLMKTKELRQIPVLDEAGAVVGLEVLDELIQLSRQDNRVVLMAGGAGSRLRPLTDECPKPLLKVGSKPILETILENFIEYGFHRFTLAVNYKAEMLKDYFSDGSRWGVEISYLHEDRAMGTAGALGLLPEKPDRPILVMNGDLLTKVNFQQLLTFHEKSGAHATMCVREYSFQIPYGVARIEKHRLIDIEEKPTQHYFVSAGVYVLEPRMLDLIPRDSYFDMPELFRVLIASGMRAATFPIREYWLDIGRMEDLERAKGEHPEIFE
jgi:dTDP-glucose pyrophosphorylase